MRNTPNSKDIWDPISVIRTRLLDQALLVGALLASVTFVIALVLSDYYFNTVGFYLDVLSLSILYLVFFFRSGFNLKARVLAILVVVSLLFISSVYQYGTVATQKSLIALIPFLSILIFDLKKTLGIFVVVMVAYFFVAYLFISGIVTYQPGPRFNSWITLWIISGLVMIIVGLVIALLVNNYNKEINTVVSDLRETTRKLEIRDQQHVEHLKEKNTMIQEIHHRVKNNLAVVSGLLMLQMSSIDDEKLTVAMQKSVNRIMSIAKVHQMLYQSEDFNKIPFKQYVDELADEILSTMNSEDKNIQFRSAIDIEYMSINQSVPLGIIFNELITNSIKYGFKNKADNKIEITVTKEQQKVHVCYTDNGPGIMNFKEASSKSLGFSLIESLFTQIDATFEYNTTQQFRLDFRFPFDDGNA